MDVLALCRRKETLNPRSLSSFSTVSYGLYFIFLVLFFSILFSEKETARKM